MIRQTLPPPRPAALPPGRRLARYRRLALTIPVPGDLGEAAARVVARLPRHCPWVRAVALRLLTPAGTLERITADPAGHFPERVRLGEPPAGWAAERGDALIILDTAAFPAECVAGTGSAAAAPLQRLTGAVVGTIEVIADQPFDLLDGDGQGLRQLGQALARLVSPDNAEHRPPGRRREEASALAATFEAAAAAWQQRLSPNGGPAARRAVLRITLAEAAAAGTLTGLLAGAAMTEFSAPDSLDRDVPTRYAALEWSESLDLYRQVHRELRRVLSQLSDDDLDRTTWPRGWIARLGELYSEP